jgi:hypothetical protein
MSKNLRPQVDEGNVDEFIRLLTPEPGKAPKLTLEERADLAHGIAPSISKLQGTSALYAKEFARRVRSRILWMKD